MERTYHNQFPVEFHPEPEIVARLERAGWVDDSWGNNLNPHWTRDGWDVFVAPLLPSDREWESLPRFALYDADGSTVVESDDLGAILAAVPCDECGELPAECCCVPCVRDPIDPSDLL